MGEVKIALKWASILIFAQDDVGLCEIYHIL